LREESALKQRNLEPMNALEVMTVVTRSQRTKNRSRLGRRAARHATVGDAERAPQLPQTAPQAREREAGGPQDLAAYCCACGYVFEAAVSTTVGCPHCGDTQAW
jgi:hypothetical protein